MHPIQFHKKNLQFWLRSLLFAGLACAFSGCYLLTPEDPPLEVKELYPDDFAWDYMDIAWEYEFIGVPHIDCPKLESYLKKTGHCEPEKLPFVTVAACPLVFPAKKLEFACVQGGNIPAVYARLTWDDNVHVDFNSLLGNCRMVGAGPANGEPERYPTDPGFKACLFESAKAPGQLLGLKGQERPAGLFFDLSNNPQTIEELSKSTALFTVDAPVSLVLDTRLFPEEQRQNGLDELVSFFNVYRKMPIVNTMSTQP